jgi:hypothetical protein
VWRTESGDVRWETPAAEAARRHPELVELRAGCYVRRSALRRVVARERGWDFFLTDGTLFVTLSREAKGAAERLGLPHLRHLEPHVAALYREKLREFPYELAATVKLKGLFRTPRELMANALFQTVRYRQLGLPTNYGDTHRGFYYDPIVPMLNRAGFLTRRSLVSKHFPVYEDLMARLVGEDCLWTYRELGLKDAFAHQRGVGARLPHVVVLAEKESLRDAVSAMVREFEMSWIITGGSPKMIQSDFFAPELPSEVRVIAFVDYDPAGWSGAKAFVRHLERYAVKVRGMDYLVRADAFTAEEIELNSLPCPPGKQTEDWVRESGGIGGLARMMHVNHLQPEQRAVDLLRALL